MNDVPLPPDIVLLVIDEVWAARDVLEASLTRAERDTYRALTVEKRARDWLAGRIAAKRAMQRALGLPFSRLEVHTSSDPATRGRPEPYRDGARIDGAGLSIAHAPKLAAACFATAPIGLDLERVEPREESFVELFLDIDERAELAHLEGVARDRAITARWCAKEAIAKLLGTGLSRPFAELTLPPSARLERGAFTFEDDELRWARARLE